MITAYVLFYTGGAVVICGVLRLIVGTIRRNSSLIIHSQWVMSAGGFVTLVAGWTILYLQHHK